MIFFQRNYSEAGETGEISEKIIYLQPHLIADAFNHFSFSHNCSKPLYNTLFLLNKIIKIVISLDYELLYANLIPWLKQILSSLFS